MWSEEEARSYNLVTRQELYDALKEIRDKAFSPVGDDEIWMDNRTPLGQYIDMHISRVF